MKKSIILLVLLLSVIIGYPQVTWEGRFDANLKTFQFNDGTLKYILFDNEENILSVYNADHSLWNAINLEIPNGHILDDIELIDESYDDNANIIILYTCYYFDHQAIEDVEEPFVNLVQTLNILNVEGTYLLKIPKIDQYRLLTTDDQSMLLVYSSN